MSIETSSSITYGLVTSITNRKVNIGAIKLIATMTNAAISVSVKFHDWLESKGKKEESYEDVIKRLLKPELFQDLKSFQGLPDKSESSDQ